ncbi:MAG: Type 1 glutamine amidotransferase-like domain-containing protein [Syntrophales bacterium LBB04]|nr:Type 1 glutamine amidotransferase-like domain-containing protein [Syntrophales bacterium LBB04]
MIAGGPQSKNNKEILTGALALIRKKTPNVAYIGTASGDSKEFFLRLRQIIMAAGAGNVSLVPIVRRFDPDKARDMLLSSDVVFISGGDVDLGMKYLRNRKLVAFFREIYDQGKIFCGISAGAIMLSRSWIHWRDPDDDDTIELLDCLGFAPLLCDVHAEEDNWVEMKRLLGFFPQGTAGYGIPANGALRVAPDGKITSIGSSPVRFIKKSAEIIIVLNAI